MQNKKKIKTKFEKQETLTFAFAVCPVIWNIVVKDSFLPLFSLENVTFNKLPLNVSYFTCKQRYLTAY